MPNKRQIARQFNRLSAAAEERWRNPIRVALNNQTNAFFDYAESQGIQNALLLLDDIVTDTAIANVLFRLYTKEGAKAGRQEERSLNSEYGSEYKAFSFFTDWLKNMTNFFYTDGMKEVRRITDTTRNLLRRKAAEAAEQQLTIPEMRDKFIGDEINKKRANVIARTETITVLKRGSDQAVRSAPIKFNKEWISIHDKRTRHSHVRMDGEIVPLEQPFSNGGMYPGDPDLSAKERIQCRCTKVHIAVRDANGRLVRK